MFSWIVVVGEDIEKPVVDGRRADALLAAHYAQEAALRLCKTGNEVIQFLMDHWKNHYIFSKRHTWMDIMKISFII